MVDQGLNHGIIDLLDDLHGRGDYVVCNALHCHGRDCLDGFDSLLNEDSGSSDGLLDDVVDDIPDALLLGIGDSEEGDHAQDQDSGVIELHFIQISLIYYITVY